MVNLPRGREISGLHGVRSLLQGAKFRLVRLYGQSANRWPARRARPGWHREALTHALQSKVQEILPVTLTVDPVDWHTLDAAYLPHHFDCPSIIMLSSMSVFVEWTGVNSHSVP